MGAPGTFHVAVGVIIEHDDKILITKRAPTREHAPNEWEAGITGRVDQGETCEEAAYREVKEELAITIELITPFRTFHFYRGPDRVEHLGVNFWARYVSGDIVLDPLEQVAYKWVSPEEAMGYIIDDNVRTSVADFIACKKRYSI